MQRTLIVAALIVAVVAATIAVGWKLPAEHRTVREAEFRHGAEELWATIADFPSLPAWMPGIRRVQKLDAVDGRERWLYETAEGDMTIEVVARSAPTVLSIRTVNSDLAFGGTWTHRISPTASGSLLTITEHGWITNPFFRFMFRYVFGVASTPDEALTALGRYLGEKVKPRQAVPLTG
ncbi:hypothetical protein BH23GEM1_BH23GEM1_08180 [soil metagenome]